MLERLRRMLPTPEAVRANRWLRWLAPVMNHPRLWHMSRRGIALGVAIGVFFAFLVPIAQIPLSVAVAVALRANIPTAVASTLINNPLTFPPVYYAAWRVGSAVLGQEAHPDKAPVLPGITDPQADPDPHDERSLWRRSVDAVAAVGKPLLVGATLFAVAGGLLAYLLVNGIWHLHVRLKRRKRLGRRPPP